MSNEIPCRFPESGSPPGCALGHWVGQRGEGILDDGTSELHHVGDEANAMTFQAGVMPEGTCVDGHDARLERFMQESAERAHAMVASNE